MKTVLNNWLSILRFDEAGVGIPSGGIGNAASYRCLAFEEALLRGWGDHTIVG